MRKRLTIFAVTLIVTALSVLSWAAWTAGQRAGTRVYSDIQHLPYLESTLIHPTHTDGLVDVGDPVLFGDEGIIGVCVTAPEAATGYAVVESNSVWNLVITNAVAMSAGDAVYVDNDSAALTDSPVDSVKFGHVMTGISGTAVATTVPIMVMGVTQELSTIAAISVTGLLTAQAGVSVTGGGVSGTTTTMTGLIQGADVYATDDARIGDDLDVDGAVRVDEAIGTSQTITAAGTITGNKGFAGTTATLTGNVTFSDSLKVGGATLPRIAAIEVTSTTLVGADNTTFTLTLHGWVTGKTVVNLSLQSGATAALGLGVGNIDYWRIEGGGYIDGTVNMTSATAGTMTVHCTAFVLE